jgi:cell division protein FtsI (penicillin-binding protein 3)
VLGFVGAENRGLHGLEARLDDVVGGQPGVMNIRRDARFNRLLTEVRQPAVAGASVELTIDETLQYIVERELLAGIIEANAVGGAVVMLEPETGAILAMTSYPTFNPNDYASAADEIWRNRATQDVYEPGSTFKIVTASAAIEDGLYAPDDIIDIQYGRLFVPGRGRLVTDDHASATLLTFEDVIVKSSNVGAVLIGQKAGKERITRYAQRFGFGQRLAPDFAGESAGRVYAAGDLTENGLASMSMGYQVSVTALQMASAMNTIANGGRLMEPQLVRAITRDGVREEVAPKALRQAIRPETAATLTGFLENVVSRGTARAAQPEGFQAAGKTGTTKKAVPGGYSETDRVSSFVGFAPSRQPAFTILVMIDTPRNGQVYGGAVAAPVFKRIAEAALRRAGTTPTRNAEPPVVITAAADRARAEVWPVSIERTTLDLGSEPTMPDLRGLSARDAAAILRELGLEFRIAGAGTVASQVPAPGEVIRPGDWGALQLRRGAARPGADTGGGRR